MADFTPIALSFTTCKTSRCSFRLQYNQQHPEDSGDNYYASMGVALHVIAAQVAHRCRTTGRVSDVGYGRNLLKKLVAEPRWDEFQREHLEVAGDRLVEGLSIPRHYDQLIIEQRFAVDRNYQPIPVGTPVDRFEGTPDLAWIEGQVGGLLDHKLGPGPPELDYSEAKHDRQLLAYSALLFIHNPELQQIAARKNFWRWKNSEQSPWDFQRDTCLDDFKEWLSVEWERIDENRRLHGDGPWPAHASAGTCGSYCNLVHVCPAYADLRSRFAGVIK